MDLSLQEAVRKGFPIKTSALYAVSRVLHVGGGAYVPEGGGGLDNRVAVAHPHRGVVPDTVHQGVGVIVPHELRAAILASLG